MGIWHIYGKLDVGLIYDMNPFGVLHAVDSQYELISLLDFIMIGRVYILITITGK